MAYRLYYTDESLDELEKILEAIQADNPQAADRFASALFDHLELLETFPHLGIAATGRPRVRKLLHSPVRVYYSLDNQRRLITILHFWHTSRREPKLT